MTAGTVALGAIAPLRGVLPTQCQRDIDTLRRFVRESFCRNDPADAVSPDAIQEVLLTGGTGFVGRFVLRDLLRESGGRLAHCIVRARDEAEGFSRLRAALEQAEIWDEEFASRIRVVAGDVTDTRFGLDQAGFDSLCARVDAVYHLAADLTLASSYAALRRSNAFSIRNVLELCLQTRLKPLFFTSSMSVFPQYFFAFGNEFRNSRIGHQAQPDLDIMKRKYPLSLVGYPWSKLVAEQVLLFARSAGLPVGIFRLPRTAIAGTGPCKADDVAACLFAAAAEVEAMPQGFAAHRLSEAADTLSRILTAISLNPCRNCTIYHCCDPRPAMLQIEPADLGLYWPEVSYSDFRRACQARGASSSLRGHWALVDHFAPYWFGKPVAGAAQPVCDRAIREDCTHPIKWPGLLTMSRHAREWVERHRSEWPHPVPRSRLDYDCLMRRAERYAEREDVPFEQACPEWIRRGVRHLIRAMKASETGLLEDRLADIVLDMSSHVRINAALARERRQHPGIEREEVARPVFIVGVNRTGTTFLHRLMARAKRFRTLTMYELLEPVRPADEYASVSGTSADPRRAWLEDLLEASGAVESYAGVHDIDIDEPEEDFPLLRLGFAAWINLVRYPLPDYARWLSGTGSRQAYAHHRRVMQHFTWQHRQRASGGEGQWLLKMPFHLMELEALIETYPDALFIQTHREPSHFMGSWNSLVERIRAESIEPRPRDETGAEQLAFMSGMLNKAVAFRDAHPELEHRWVDVSYPDLVRNPLAVIRHVHDRFDWTLDETARAAMSDWLSRQAERRKGETRHRYGLEDYGLTEKAVAEAFAPYRDFIEARGIRTSCLPAAPEHA